MPKFNSISISGYTCRKREHRGHRIRLHIGGRIGICKHGLKAGIDIDSFAPSLSFFWAIGMNYFMEVAKMRAARMIWAKLIKQFNPKNEKSMALSTVPILLELDGARSIQQRDKNLIEAMAATLGHTQSLHTNALDEAIALPTDFSARIARNTQLYLQDETGI